MEKTTEKVINAVIYIRVSSQEQVRHGYSLDSQREHLIEYCKSKGYKVIDIYADEGKSARTKLKNRTELLRLVEDAKKHKFNRIVFWRLDRWFRNIKDYYKVQEILEDNKIDWECSSEEYNTTTSNGRLHLNIKLSIAQNESDQTSDRIKFNFAMMVQKGNIIVGQQGMPLGYKASGEAKNKRMIKDEETEHIVEDMWNNIQETGSIRQTLIYINQKYNLDIIYDSMRHYLMNEKYYGYYRGNENYCPAYISKETFDKVQSIIRHNVKFNKRHDYIFSGLLVCPICHHKLAGFTSKTTKSHGKKVEFRYPSYRCNLRYQQRCSYSKRPVEKTIESYLLNNIEDIINTQVLEISKLDEKKEEPIKIDKEKLKQRMDRLTDIYLEGRISKEKYSDEFDRITELLRQADKIETEEKQNDNLNNIKDLFNKDMLSLYNNLDNKGKRMFWSSFIEYIEINENNEFNIHFKK
jgi:DNA invertase Pin-like site-specific DNA recombinase